jgi:small nuclear ribonucleoprotein (snRNP)-like protein
MLATMKVLINNVPKFQRTSEFGALDSVHTIPHSGIDLALPYGTDILCPTDGIVSRIIDMGSENIGKAVVIKLKNGNELIFGHLSKFNVHVNDVVHTGQKLAESGNSGFSTGAHLHIGLKTADGNFVDPSVYESMFQKAYDHGTNLASMTDGSLFNFFKKGAGEDSLAREFIDSVRYLKEFIADAKAFGIWHAVTGETFGTAVLGALKHAGFWLLDNNDLFLLAPAILFAFCTFLIGKNKYTRYIIPLFFIYFITEVMHHLYDIDTCVRPKS